MGLFNDLMDKLKSQQMTQINDFLSDDLRKTADSNMVPDSPTGSEKTTEQPINQKAIIDDPFFDQVHQHFIFKNKLSRISNKTLKDVSVRDWVVSAIIQARSDTMLLFSRPQHKLFEMGFKIQKRDHKEDISDKDMTNIANLEEFLYRCGRTERTPKGEEMLFGEFLKLCTRDALTFGHIAVEKILTRAGGLHRFRPIPAEEMYLINKKTDRKIIEKEIESAVQILNNQKAASPANDNNPEHGGITYERDIDYYKYVQMSYDNRVLAAFGDEDMVFKLFNPQNFADAMGYCYSPLELSIINVTNHLNIENYNANFFTHGYAARGVLHLKGTVTQAQLTAFRRQFYNTISGAHNAWRTPIIAGLDEVQWVPLAANAKEMEYLNYNNHIIRSICTQFQIDPTELGLDYLISGGTLRSGSVQNNESKITFSRERGLYPILMMFEDLVNCDILPAIDKELAKEYEFKFVGYTDETPQTNVALLQAEMTVYSSMNDLLRQAGKSKIDHISADLPLNAAFWQIIEKNMTRGEIRETFFKDEGASKRRELQYLPSDPAFMGWNQLLLTIDRSKKQDQMQQQQMAQEAKAQQSESQQVSEQNKREQEKHDLEVKNAHMRHAHHAVDPSKSLKDTAKEYGAASKPLEVGGEAVANPINKSSDEK